LQLVTRGPANLKHRMRALLSMRYEVSYKSKRRELTWILSGGAVLAAALAGCGGGGGGSGAAPAAADSAVGVTTAPASGSTAPVAATAGVSPVLADCDMFPSTSIFNTRIDDATRFPAHARSNAWISMVGNVPFMPNWGNSSNPAQLDDYWGMPINVVDGTSATTRWPVVSFDFSASGVSTELGYPDKSDCAVAGGDGFAIAHDCSAIPAGSRRFPFPSGQTLAEGGLCGGPGDCGDHHVLVVEKGACRLWEAHFAHNISGQWYAVATAAWDLKSNAMRPDYWGSADAAGLPITPLLAKASEAATGEIRHALRVTFRNQFMSVKHLWPARYAVGLEVPGNIPFGALLRLRADFVIPDNWSPQAKAVANAAKRYGMYVADNGMDFFIQGEPSDGWDPQAWQQLRTLTLQNMEFVDLRSITSDPRFSSDSMQASW
jgi:hypothetical protein